MQNTDILSIIKVELSSLFTIILQQGQQFTDRHKE